MVPNTAVTVINKLNAFFQGNLEFTMAPDTGKYKKDYMLNALGQKVPRATE